MVTISFQAQDSAGRTGLLGIVVANKRPMILYVLGTAYTGSTLFGLALGQQQGVVNLGEVINLENDYAPGVKCTCGEMLQNCEFWSRITSETSKQQERLPADQQWTYAVSAKREYIDEKGNYLKKLMMTLGRSCRSTFGDAAFTRYAAKNAAFFHSMHECVPSARAFVDLSKSPERLEALLSRDDLDVRVILLKRSPLSVFASSIKRPKRSRANLGPKVLREAALQYLRFRHCVRALDSVDPRNRMVVSFERFIENPVSILNDVLKLVGLSVTNAPLENGRLCLFPSRQHVYVGNRWLFRDCSERVVVTSRDDSSTLTRFQKKVLRSVYRTSQLDSSYGPESI